MLPDHDKLHGIEETSGIYSLNRWPSNVNDLITFLNQLKTRWGESISVSIVDEYDGYPGYIQVHPN